MRIKILNVNKNRDESRELCPTFSSDQTDWVPKINRTFKYYLSSVEIWDLKIWLLEAATWPTSVRNVFLHLLDINSLGNSFSSSSHDCVDKFQFIFSENSSATTRLRFSCFVIAFLCPSIT